MSSLDLCQELRQNFIDYAYAVNTDRAIPSAADGLKPVARRILWGMQEGKFFSNKAYIKCARVVGDVMGKYHPHGDSSIYDAMTRLSLGWGLRYPLIDWHGNQGNIAGDKAASYRYTECRLAKIAEDGILDGINKDAIDFQPNYDETLLEPVLMPAVFPNLLCNPNEGIGLAMACKWLPHNLNDIADTIIDYIKDEELNFSNLFPDFPTGGTIVNKEEVQNIYKTGRGKVVVESKYREEKRGNHRLLVFYEIPYQVFIESIIEKIQDLCEKEKLPDVIMAQDQSGKASGKKGIRIVVEVTKDANIDHVLAQLFSETDLRKSFSANQVALVGKTPKLLNLEETIQIYIQHNIRSIQKQHEYDLGRVSTRVEILEGLSRALEDIDKIIELIKTSPSAKEAQIKLMSQYSFSELQAKSILDMKLSRLANLEKIEVTKELQEKQELAKYLSMVVNSVDKQKEILVERLEDVVKKYGDNRRTDVTQKTIVKVSGKAKDKTEIIPEDIVVTFSKTGYLQAIPVKTYKKNNNTITNFKTTTIDIILLFSNKGKVYRISGKDIAMCGNRDKGTAIGSIIKLDTNEKIIGVFSSEIKEKEPYLIFVMNNGLVKKTEKIEYLGETRNLTGIKAVKLKDDSEIIFIQEANDTETITLGTKENIYIRFKLAGINPTGKASMGVKGITLDNDEVQEVIISGLDKAVKTNNGLHTILVQGRGGKGKKYAIKS